MKGPPLGPGEEDIAWPDQVVTRARKASSTHKIKPQTSNLKPSCNDPGEPTKNGGLLLQGGTTSKVL